MRILVTNLLQSATCDLSGRDGECLEISSDDGSIRGQAVVSPQEFLKQLRFIAKQESKTKGDNSKPRPSSPTPSPSVNATRS